MSFLSSITTKLGQAVSSLAPTPAKIQNVKDVYVAALTGKGVTATTPSPTVNKVLGAVASNPYTSAAVVAGGLNPSAAVGTLKYSVSSGTAAVKTAAVALGGPAAVSYVIARPETIKDVSKVQSSSANFAGNVGTFADDPSLKNLKTIATENPIISGAVLGGAALIAGKGITSAATGIANTIATSSNTAAIKEMTSGGISSLPSIIDKSTPLPAAAVLVDKPITASSGASLVPITPETQVLGKPASSGSKRAKSRLKQRNRGNFAQSMRINIFNQSKHLYSRAI